MLKSTIAISMLYVALFMGCTSSSKTKKAFKMNEGYDFSNHDVKWEGSFVGLFPVLSEKAIDFRNNYPEDGDSQMLSYLNDEKKFVFAHVILCLKYDRNIIADKKWNGLSVELKSNGKIEYNFEEREEIEKKWAEVLNK